MDLHPSASNGAASRACPKAVDELRQEDLTPLKRPEEALRSVIARLQAANAAKKKELDWRDHYDALNEARRLVAHHGDLVRGSAREFVLSALPALEMLRSATVRNGMALFQEVVPVVGRGMDKLVEDVAPVVLKKAGEAATAGSGRDTFLVAEADKALSILINTVSNSRAISALLASASHKSMSIRCKVAACLDEVLDAETGRVGAGPSQSVLERVLKTALSFTEEGAQDTRTYGKRIIWHVRHYMGSNSGFEKLLVKCGPDSKQRKMREVLQARCMPPLPARSLPRSQGRQQCSSPSITPTTPSLSPVSRTSSGGTGPDSVCSDPSSPEPTRPSPELGSTPSPARRQSSGASASKTRPPSADSVSSHPLGASSSQPVKRDAGLRHAVTPVARQNSSPLGCAPGSPMADSVSSHPLSASPEPAPRRAPERRRVPTTPVRRQNSGASDSSRRIPNGYRSPSYDSSPGVASRRSGERRRVPVPVTRQNSFGSDSGSMPRTPKRAGTPSYASPDRASRRMPTSARSVGSAGGEAKTRPPTVIPREPRRQRSVTPPVRSGKSVMDTAADAEAAGLEGAVELMSSKDWRQRMGALRAVAALADTVPQEADAVVIPLMDTITQRLSDGNSKVIVVALETLKTLFECAADDLAFHMNILVPALSSSLGSTNDKIRACSEEVIDQLLDAVDHTLLIQAFSHSVANGNPKGRVVLLGRLPDIVANVYPRKPQLVIKHALPLAFKMMAESKADLRAANVQLIVTLAEFMGDQLFAYAGNVSLPSKMRLKEMIKSHGIVLGSGSPDLRAAR